MADVTGPILLALGVGLLIIWRLGKRQGGGGHNISHVSGVVVTGKVTGNIANNAPSAPDGPPAPKGDSRLSIIGSVCSIIGLIITLKDIFK